MVATGIVPAQGLPGSNFGPVLFRRSAGSLGTGLFASSYQFQVLNLYREVATHASCVQKRKKLSLFLFKSERHGETRGQSSWRTTNQRLRFHKLRQHRTVLRLCFLQNAVHVIFHRLKREIQATSDLLVCQSLYKQGRELLFARC
jgi:hypothetical protein